ncbi:MAG TPA: hypothetical protein VLB74_08530 [Flavobacterium sp.]|uniref:hypothetical protein n=1 Tax=Flavobacterium sp. TaxID=239 RepID=UPI002B508FB9|nr:hypothetical protein [Flavobacterium sp.]HSD14679.1 hypothetical protein [Flavobacterium sp.]
MKPKPKRDLQKLLIAFAIVFFNLNHLQGQSSDETLFKAFDLAIGKENLAINNGPIHINEYRIINNKHQYYPTEKFENSSIVYNDQLYFDIPIKYDIYKDLVIYRPQESNAIGIELIREKTTSFTVNNKKFIYIANLFFQINQIKPGYYEENVTGKNFIFYIKHHRDKREILKGSSVFYEFEDNYEYYIKKDNSFNRISSKKDLIRLFPEYKRKINDFYFSSKKLLKSNEPLFFEKMITYLTNAMENNVE